VAAGGPAAGTAIAILAAIMDPMDVPRSLERAWMEQWRGAGRALAELRRAELSTMSDAEALEATENLLSLAATIPLSVDRRRWSGLVEQQALLHRRPVA
jgi:hypothetical protein